MASAMSSEQIERLMNANAAALDLRIAIEHRPGVLAYLALAAEMAELVQGLPLTVDDESGSVFVPAVVHPEGPVSTPPAMSSTRMELVVSRGRRIIVDAGVDVAALARVLDLLERR